MNKTNVSIKGMHCKSCELLIEDELVKIFGVKKIDISHRTGIATIYHKNHELNNNDVVNAVHAAGYTLGENKQSGFFSANNQDYIDLLFAILTAGLLFLIGRELGIFNLSVQGAGGYGNLGIVLLVGLTAGVSTCMAIVGGLVLGISARFNQSHLFASSLTKFTPHLFFNAGRVAGFFLLGGLIGILGAAFQLSTGLIGLLTIFIGGAMIFLGLQLVNIFPRLSNLTLTLPRGVSRIFGITEKAQNEYSHSQSFVLGSLTFFLPCGFTQAMQLYAISTGSFIKGATVMAVFAIGTIPGLLSVGGITSFVKGSFQRVFFKFAGVVVISLALFNIVNGFNLFKVGIGSTSKQVTAESNDPNVKLEKGVQVVHMIQDNQGYTPNNITVKKGIPVKWVVKSTYPYSCASSLVMSKYNIHALLTKEEKTFEFTPQENGQIPFSCTMGMYTGVFNVVEN